jgi:hypothetical protein
MSVVALVIAPSLTNVSSNQIENNDTQDMEQVYEVVESENVVILTKADDFGYNENTLQTLTLSNDLECSSGGAKCKQFISNCKEPIVFTATSSTFTNSDKDIYLYKIGGVLNIVGKDNNVEIYYDLRKDKVTSLKGEVLVNDMVIKFKGKK